MTIRSFASVDASLSTNSSVSTHLGFSSSTSFLSFMSAGLIFFPSASLWMLVVQDMIKAFYIGKPVTGADNISTVIYTKETLWISGVLFPSLDDAWQYILTIINRLQ